MEAEINVSFYTFIKMPSRLCSQKKGFVLGSQDVNFTKSSSGTGVGRMFALDVSFQKRWA